jgi:hypothetical protein
MGLGEHLAAAQRRAVIETWVSQIGSERIFACAWEPSDLDHAIDIDCAPIVVLRELADDSTFLRLLATLPQGAFVYSHPKYTSLTFTSEIARKAIAAGVLPAGGKICKVSLDQVTDLRESTGPEFELYDGRCRHAAKSVAAGASGVVAVPLSHLPEDLPPRQDVEALQRIIDRTQALIDQTPTLGERVHLLAGLLQDV